MSRDAVLPTDQKPGHQAPLDVQKAVNDRYSAAAKETAAALCCPVDYDPQYLQALPREIIERDYGCGDPSKYLRPGDRVLDLGSGTGKICYIAAQVVGSSGHVIGVDANDEMLGLARRYQRSIGERIGYHNTEFRKGRIQDLALDLESFQSYLAERPVGSSDDWLRAESHAEQQRRVDPMIASDSIDVIVSNCVLNLVRMEDRRQLFAEMFRVLRRQGRAVISDIVSDEPVPEHLRNDPQLWSGCISGAFTEQQFLEAFEAAGFYGLQIVARQEEPWAVVEGIEMRSVTVEAYKGKEGRCLDQNQAVVYRGPFISVTDDDGHVLRRGVRTAVCGKTFEIYTKPPYAEHFEPVPPHEPVPLEEAVEFDCRRNAVRDARETKAATLRSTQLPADDCCGSDGACGGETVELGGLETASDE